MRTPAVPEQSATLAAALGRFEGQWRAARRQKRMATAVGAGVLVTLLALSAAVAELDPARLARGIPGALAYIAGTLPRMRATQPLADLADWYWGLWDWLTLLLETLLIAYIATTLGAAVAFVGSFAAARNLTPSPLLAFATRRLFELARAVPELVYALIFVFAFGLGPLPGALAVAVHSAGALGKLFAEVNENIDPGSLEGVRAAGASWPQVMRFAVVPQVLPNFASYMLLRFELNVRQATVLGLVGAGGIGEELMLAVRQFVYPDISAIVLLIVATVALIDIGCERVRSRLMGEAGA
jgi:phosphonate transport system permease protein